MWILNHDEVDQARRQQLVAALGAGLFCAGVGGASGAHAADSKRSIHRLRGNVLINGTGATMDSTVRPGDTVATGPRSSVAFSVGDDAFLLRANSRMVLQHNEQQSVFVRALRLVSGGLLSVFGRRPHRLVTANATIGIRGTGVYAEASADEDYICTCYGMTTLIANAAPDEREIVSASHHDARYILRASQGDALIRQAPVINHTGAELTLIESLVGRIPEYRGDYDEYARPRRRRRY